MKYRNTRNAEATARFWGKPLDRSDWYKVNSQSDDEAEVLIYDVIGWPFSDASELVRALAGMKQKTITVRINSPGGDVFDAMAIFNALQAHGSKIVTRIESLAASAASFIALAGKETQAYPNAMIMIHEPWAHAAGSQFDLREIADVLEKISGNMVDIYAANTKVGKREIKDMLKAETWLTAKDALEKGFIGKIIDGKAAKAQFDLSMFANTPDSLKSTEANTKPDKRTLEHALRDAGLTQVAAKAVIARGFAAIDEDEATISAAQRVLKIIRGGK